VKGQTVPNFITKSCDQKNYDLYEQVDSTKTVIMCWVKPDQASVDFATSAYTVTQQFPDSLVDFYLCDDWSNTSCQDLTSWANTNGITDCSIFSDSAVLIDKYGGNEAPMVLLVGKGRVNLYEESYSIHPANLNSAIKLALIGPINTRDTLSYKMSLSITPNPANDHFTCVVEVPQKNEVTFKLYNSLGVMMSEPLKTVVNSGRSEIRFPAGGYQSGAYYLQAVIANRKLFSKVVVLH
jgi:hypothetical protein